MKIPFGINPNPRKKFHQLAIQPKPDKVTFDDPQQDESDILKPTTRLEPKMKGK